MQSTAVVLFSLLVVADQRECPAEVAQCSALCLLIVVFGRRRQRDDQYADLVLPVAASFEVRHQAPRQQPRMAAEPLRSRLTDRRQQHGVLRGEPGEGFLIGRRRRGHDTGRRWRQVDRVAIGVQTPFGRPAGMQVVVEHPAHGRGAACVVVGVGQLGGVHAQQVVHAEPMGHTLFDEMRGGEPTEPPAAFGQWHPEEARGGQIADVGADEQAEQPERGLVGGRQCPVRPREHRAQIQVGVAEVERVQAPVLVLELLDQLGEPCARPIGDPRGRDAQRQRQASAPADEHHGVLGLFRDTFPAGASFQQRDGVGAVEQSERQRMSAFPCAETVQPVPAGDECDAAGTARQQRPHVLGVPGVVQHDQQAAFVQQAAVQTRFRVRTGRHGLGSDAQRGEEAVQRLRAGHRLL